MELNSIIVPQEEVLPNEKVIYNTNSVPGKNLPITLKHQFMIENLKVPKKMQNSINLFRDLFTKLEISIIITNYRVIFEPIITGNLGKGFKKLFEV